MKHVLELGGKEKSLLALQGKSSKLEFIVPDFLVLDDSATTNELRNIQEYFQDKPIIVRSNSLLENDKNGFDGIYDSIVVRDCTLENLEAAYDNVLASLDSEKAIKYRNDLGLPEDTMRVIFQEFIESSRDFEKYSPLMYGVIETSINAIGDYIMVLGENHNAVNTAGYKTHEFVFSATGKVVYYDNMATGIYNPEIIQVWEIATALHSLWGPVSLECAIQMNYETEKYEVFLFQRRKLPVDMYAGKSVDIPTRYIDTEPISTSKIYRGGGKIENFPVIVMGKISGYIYRPGHIELWQKELMEKAKEFPNGYILLVKSMHTRANSPKVLYNFKCLKNAKAIISSEKMDLVSHAFRVAMISKKNYVSIGRDSEMFTDLETGDLCSIYFTDDKAVIYKD